MAAGKMSEEQIAELKQVTSSLQCSGTGISKINPIFQTYIYTCTYTYIYLCQAFNEFDVDGGGNISTKELGWAMRAMGMNPTEDDLLQLINEVTRAGCLLYNVYKDSNDISIKY